MVLNILLVIGMVCLICTGDFTENAGLCAGQMVILIEDGIQMTADMLNEILWVGMKTTVLVETMAGKGTEIGKTFEEVRAILDLVKPEFQPYIGVCLDTCHISDAGYPLEKDTDGVIA